MLSVIYIFTFSHSLSIYLKRSISDPPILKRKEKEKKEHVIYQIERKINNIIVIKLNSLEKGAYLEFSEPAVFSLYCDFTSIHLRDEMMISPCSCLSILRLIIIYRFFFAIANLFRMQVEIARMVLVDKKVYRYRQAQERIFLHKQTKNEN